jgi:hypothetical protein
VPFPFAAAGIAGQQNNLNLDIARWRSFNTTALNANTSRPITEICHPIVITNMSAASNPTQIAATAMNEMTTSANLFRSQSVRVTNSITKL